MNSIRLDQLDKKISKFNRILKSDIPKRGWINSLRNAIGMSLKQLGKKLHITPQGVRELERREITKSITLASLENVANSLDMRFVYGFVPREGSLTKKLESKIKEKAEEIVLITSVMMELEDQKNNDKRIKKAIAEKIAEFKHKLPKYIWD